MGKFIDDMVSLGVEALFAIPDAKKKAAKANEMIERLTSGTEEVPIEEFIEIYDLRTHNFDSKQDDIKFMKEWDFEGVYILHNCARNFYHIGRGNHVLRKIDRTFRGYENQDVYEDWSHGDKFTVWIVPLENSGYTDAEKLDRELKKQYGMYPKVEERDIPPKKEKSFWRRLFGR
ncbi:MAG: hypothetical protein ACLRT5_07105 [Lachnospiraceae bacterium]